MIILDTNVFSAVMGGDVIKIKPWLDSVPPGEIYTTAITRAEIRYGLARLPVGRRMDNLLAKADELFTEIADRIFSFDSDAADRYGVLVARRERSGRPISVPDAQIASIAWVRRSTLATRNVRDFQECDIQVVNPFEAAAGI